MYYLSIDCANKSLAIGFYKLNLNNWKLELLKILQNKNIKLEERLIQSNKLLDNVLDIKFLKVIDLIPNKKIKETTIIERSIQLNLHTQNIQNSISKIVGNNKINVFIEYQMNANDKSRAVFNQLIYAFAEPELYEIKVITPTLKNQIYFKDELKHCRILQRYSKVYTANKVHCKENFLYFLELFNKMEHLGDIKKNNIDDIADTFMQMIGYIKHKK